MTPSSDINNTIFLLVNALAASPPQINKTLFGRLKQIIERFREAPDSYHILIPLAEKFVIQLRKATPYGLDIAQQEQLEQTKAKILDLFGKMTQISKEGFEASIERLPAGSHDEAFRRFDILSSFGSVATRVQEHIFRLAVESKKQDFVASLLAKNRTFIERLSNEQKLATLIYVSTERKHLVLFTKILKEAIITAAVADSFLIFSIATENHEAMSIFLLQRGILTAEEPDRTIEAELREKLTLPLSLAQLSVRGFD